MSMKMFSLENKVALITGGAGLYGRQIVRAVAEAGASTWIASRNLEALEEVARDLRNENLDVNAIRMDQADEESVLAAKDAVMKEANHIDILVNNAVARPMKKGYQDDASRFEMSMKVNATGLFVITRAVGDVMSDNGSIINIGSIMGLIGPEPANYKGTDMSGWHPAYFFHKGGMVNYTRFIASYYGARGIRCNCIHPGGFFNNQPELFVREYNERTCLGRMANETDLMGAVVFLASDASLYVTGANIPVDGGYTAK